MFQKRKRWEFLNFRFCIFQTFCARLSNKIFVIPSFRILRVFPKGKFKIFSIPHSMKETKVPETVATSQLLSPKYFETASSLPCIEFFPSLLWKR